MSVAAPKSQAKEPIDLDVLFVCRKKDSDKRPFISNKQALRKSQNITTSKITRFNSIGRRLSRNDIRVILFSQLLVELAAGRDEANITNALKDTLIKTRNIIDSLWKQQCAEIPNLAFPQLNLF
jgi:hypothetical protein